MKPAPCSFTPRLLKFSLARKWLRAGYVCADGQIGKDLPCPLCKRDLRYAIIARLLADHLLQHPRSLAGRAHRHRDAHRRALGAVHPRMVRDGEGEV